MSDVSTGDEALVALLKELRQARAARKALQKQLPRRRFALSREQRALVLKKTDGRCHICGGDIESGEWQADHVKAHSQGGTHVVENYLAAHATCNNYRWDYGNQEFQLILKLGVWVRTQIEQQTAIGAVVAAAFAAKERRRIGRLKRA